MKRLALIIFLSVILAFSSKLDAQVCSGTINTVWKDDFGHGTDQLSAQTSPNITNGYTYEDFGVHSGHYALVNRFDYFGSWHLVPEDHTPADTGGYFLVIDGNPAVPIFYETIVRDVCPFTQYSFSTFAMNMDLPSFPSDQTFTFIISDTLGNVLATWDSPPVAVGDNPVWVQMGFSFNSGNNIALRLQARFNATGYDDFAFDDFEFSVCGPALSVNTNVLDHTCADSIPLFSTLGSGYASPVYQWQKKNAAGIFENIPGATSVNYTDRSLSDSNEYKLLVGDGSLSCPIEESRLIIRNCITSTCNNWLNTPVANSYADFGEIDVPGTAITVEATFYQTGNSPIEGDLVSKHQSPSDANYLLRPNHAYITTSNGFFGTPDICVAKLEKMYHVAMVYDGNTLKFYRDGFLMSQVNATGTLFQNNFPTRTGLYTGAFNENFIGYINEVRIWNTVRTQAQIQNYMNAPLPSPSSQMGLLAYYTFDNLINKQGNTAFNGTINSNASINTIVPACDFIADSCPVITNIQNIINYYTPVIALNSCNNQLTVEDASGFKIGDTVLMIQMKGAVVDSSNTPSFGRVIDYKSAGNYEFNYIKNITGNVVELLNTVTRTYEIPNGLVQLVRVPYYDNVTVSSTLTCLPWDGKKGGILVFNVNNELTLNADIDVSGKGFKGGAGLNLDQASMNCSSNDFYYPQAGFIGAAKGEGIAIISDAKSYGKGQLANGGGGGNAHNSGGGGGSNAATGGFGGYQLEQSPWTPCDGSATDNRGIPASALNYTNTLNKIYLGGGGGAGHDNNGERFGAAGGNGGGIIIISAQSITGNNRQIISKGDAGLECNIAGATACHEGMGGGGAGGTILCNTNNLNGSLTINSNGGKGADMIAPSGYLRVGPGGGGSGGVCWFKSSSNPGAIIQSAGGASGVCTQTSASPWGATPGSNGINLFNLLLPVDTVLFKPNIDSLKITESLSACRTFSFKGFAFTNTNAIQSWQWSFGDNSFASTQNTAHTYNTTGNYTVKLVVTDINGCKDSLSKPVSVTECITGISGIINYYTPVIAFNPCDNKITVEDASGFKVGDTVLMIQMKGAVIDSTNTAAFGTITDYKNAGNYEFNYINSISGNVIEIKNTLTRQYDVPNGVVQLIRVPYYQNVSITDTLTCLPWDGRKGGVLVLNVEDTVNMQADISVTGRGFRGGQDPVTNPSLFYCYENQFYYPVNPDLASQKGEGIAIISDQRSFGKGALGNGGGGGNSHNSAGGGGANAGAGGLGGYPYEFSPCDGVVPFDNRGIGGKSLAFSNAANKIFMGGGGGAGQSNNLQNFQATGGHGSGIAIIKAATLRSNTHSIFARGNDGTACGNAGAGCHEGMGGGGAGGACLLDITSYIDNATVNNSGGKGADMTAAGFYRVGPGGGGGGGITWVSQASLPANMSLSQNGGANGICTGYGDDTWGSLPGQNGNAIFNLSLPVSNQPFTKNIDSVKINDSIIACRSFNFKGLAFTNTNAIQTWQWSFGDNSFASTQNTTHTYSTAGNYTVKLVVTDINGCKDSLSKPVSVTECITGIKGIINYYTPVIAFNPCDNKITVEDASGFKVGDTVLMIQMKGAVIDSTNTAAFGTITDYKNAGNYEFNYVKSIAGNIVELKNVLLRQYDVPVGRVQLIRAPFYTSIVVTDTLTCLPWDGRKGGVLVFNVQDTLILDQDLDVSGKGFRGGQEQNNNTATVNCGQSNFFYPLGSPLAAAKGEGIAEVSQQKQSGRGKLANGGGGGNDHNAGGGGGANAASGGSGGNEFNLCPGGPAANGGVPGAGSNNYISANKIYLGGGGGSGHANDPSAQPFTSGGGKGGGIIIVSANYLRSNSKKITSNGADATTCPGANCNDGGGGGGAGGAVLLDINNYIGNIRINSRGGKGASTGPMPTFITGPGGGGGGGVVWFKQVANPSGILDLSGGDSGFNTTVPNTPSWGAQPGALGISFNSLVIPITSVLFKPNIDSVRINDSLTSCKTFSFKGLGYTNRNPVQTWQWSFGDNGTANTQNTFHNYANTGDYTVKLVVTDINGCKDSVTKTVRVVNCTDTVINSYAAVLSLDVCTNTATVDDIAKFHIGDTVVIMQMKGASIDSTNSNTFGTITSYNNAGKYEFNYIKTITGNTIEFSNTFLRKYDALRGRVQLIRVPYFPSFTVSNPLTCPAWDGTKGGVLIVNSATDVTLNAPIDVSNKGFRGGAVGGGFSCGNINSWAAPTGFGGTKGEGIAEYIPGFEAGGARLANGGGGAYAANSGGGGGGNWGGGGLGGFHSNTCPSPTQSMAGAAVFNITPQQFVLGGGGGGGQQDNGQPVAAGGNGGGMVIIKANTLNSNKQQIIANGESVTATVKDEGGAGGGAGGTILLFVNNYTDTLYTHLDGGKGSSNFNEIYPTRCHGPGGGGGGGHFGISTNGVTAPASLNTTTNGGQAGTVDNPNSACANTTNGATAGAGGSVSFNLVLPEATVPFKKNIDSVRINETFTTCKTFDFKGLAFINTNPVQKWEWNFGDGATDTTQNTTHTYTSYGSNNVKLVITDVNGCKDSITKTVTTNGINFDFVFEQDICNPLMVHFRAVGDTTAEIFWSKGDGTMITDIRNPTHIYPSMGSYLVEYCTGNASTGCIDTVKKTIFIGWINDNIILTPDTTICFGSSKLLRSNIDSTLQFCWNPVTYLNNPGLADPTTSTPSTITYSLNGTSEENNLVVNGDFSNGNTGFASDYDSSAVPLSIAEYFVGNSSLNVGPSTANCSDHTTATGKMLIARSDFNAVSQVWGQKVNVTPNTNYTFSAWVQSLVSPNNTTLQLAINENVVVSNIRTSNPTCEWTRHFVHWNSGNNTTADLSIIYNTAPPRDGGYFAIDDISLTSYTIKRDTVKITVDTPFIYTRTDTSVCESVPVQLTTTGAVHYTWTPATGLSSATAESPVATPGDTTKYIVTGTNAFGCIAADSVIIAVKPKPTITSTGDTIICFNNAAQLFASGGTSYKWAPAVLLNDPNIANPVANPSTANTKYVVTVTGSNNCISKDSFTVSVKPLPVFAVSADQSVCLNTQAQLNASGGNAYLWSPVSLVSNSNISNPLATTQNTTSYSVLIRDTVCSHDTTLTTSITVLPLPTVTASKENDVNCAIGTSQLSATGASQYSWAPASTLNDATSPVPIASPVSTTTYTVNGSDANGCSNSATVTVLADYSIRVSYMMPNAFSPNRDGINDCFRPKYFGLITELQFMVYNRWGEKVFFTTNPNDCWDGTYKGVPCDSGNFVYYLKAKTTCGNVERKGNVVLVR